MNTLGAGIASEARIEVRLACPPISKSMHRSRTVAIHSIGASAADCLYRLHLLSRDRRSVPELPASVCEAWRRSGNCGCRPVQEIEGSPPNHLRDWWTHDPGACTRQLGGGDIWERTGIMDINVADTMPDGWQVWLDWQRAVAARESQEWFRSVWHSGDLVLHLGITGRDGSLTF